MTIRNNRGQFIKGSKFWLGKKRPDISLLQKGKPKLYMLGDKNPRWSGGPKRILCVNCHKEFMAITCKDKRRFCSKKCWYEFRKKEGLIIGSKNPLWKGGVTVGKNKLKETEIYHRWRQKVFERDWFRCKMCGYKGRKIEAHHIVAISDNPKLCLKEGNGITLCKKCHLETYGKEKQFAMVFKKILNDFTPDNPKG